MTFIAVGGGPTGIELAGRPRRNWRFTLEEIPQGHPRASGIRLVEPAPTIRGRFVSGVIE